MEADQTYFGKQETPRVSPQRKGRPYSRGAASARAASERSLALVERGGNIRTFHVAVADKITVTQIVRENMDHETRLHTDESALYGGSAAHFADHETVHHSSKEYVRGACTRTRWKAISAS